MTFFQALWELSNAMALYILLGLLIAGILHQAIPEDLIQRHLGSRGLGSIIKATFIGIPIPVCSCGVIPLAASLQKSGASKGSVLAFLISTPITGIDSILATYGMFGWFFTIYRIVTATILALLAGWLVDRSDTAAPTIFTVKAPSCCSECGCEPRRRKFSIKEALAYGFGTLLGDIAVPLFWGLVIGALITTAIPNDLSNILSAHPSLSYLIAIAIATPMYVCATASLPIAAALILSGVSIGAAFVFLSAGPATNTVTIGVVKKMLGLWAAVIYVSTIVIGSIFFGLLLDMFYEGVDVANIVHIQHHDSPLFTVASVVMWGLLGHHLLKSFKKANDSCQNHL